MFQLIRTVNKCPSSAYESCELMYEKLGGSCSPVALRATLDQEVEGMNAAKCWAFFSSLRYLSQSPCSAV